MVEELVRLQLDSLRPHPKNPRLMFREDVIESIRAQLEDAGEFSEMHAPIVRPVNGHYEIISGHHRVEAAKRAKLGSIPCWVKPMTEDEAYMQLVLGNSQGELSPLEIGIHALGAIEPSEGGRGVTGGVSEYARQIGRDKSYISYLRDAAEVYQRISKTVDSSQQFSDKAKHLAAIHKAHRELWPMLVGALLDKEWSVADTEHWVGKVREFDIPQPWAEVFLPLQLVVKHFLDTFEFSPATAQKLAETAERIENIIASYGHAVDVNAYTQEFRQWLHDGTEGYAWDVRQLVKYQRELIAQLEQAEIEAERRWNLGNWRGFVGELAAGSITLLLTDPPYGVEFQSDYKLDRREERNHAVIANDGDVSTATGELSKMLGAFWPKLADNAHLLCFTHWSTEAETRQAIEGAGFTVRGSLIWAKNNTGMGDPNTTFAPEHERIIHAVKGSPMLFQREGDVLEYDRITSARHPNEKPVPLLKRLIEVTTVEGELVADPFGGVASTLVAAQQSGREFWGCELDVNYHSIGRGRLETRGGRSS